MKKLFGFLTLFLCLLLTACNMNLLSDRSGSIDFSIPTKDIIDAANNYAARSGDDLDTSEYVFLVQIRGNRRYYDSIIQKVNVSIPNPDETLIMSENYLKDNNKIFSFDRVPAGQTYKVMFNMFITDNNGTHLVFAGHTDKVKVSAGKTAEAGITAKSFNSSIITFKIIYEDGTSESFEPWTYWQIQEDQSTGGQMIMYPPMTMELRKDYGKLVYMDKTIKDIYYILNPDSNFDDPSFSFSIPYDDPKIENATKYYDLKFTNNICSIKYFFSRILKLPAGNIPSGSDGLYTFGSIKVSNNKISYIEPSSQFTIQSSDEVLNGTINNQTWTFESKTCGNDTVLIHLENIRDILSDLQKSWTGALVLKMKGDSVITSQTDLYYNFISKSSLSEITTSDDLFSGCGSISHKQGEKRYLIPINGIGDTNSYLAVFVKSSAGAVNVSFDIEYVLFPPTFSTYVFGIGREYSGGREYRYEVIESLGVPPQDNGNYGATLYGVFCKYNISGGYFSREPIELKTELYDAAYCVNHDDSPWFHPLSNNAYDNQIEGNIKVLTTEDSTSPRYYEFKYMHITNIPEVSGNSHDMKFMCTAECDDPNTLLVARYWETIDYDLPN